MGEAMDGSFMESRRNRHRFCFSFASTNFPLDKHGTALVPIESNICMVNNCSFKIFLLNM